MKKRLPIFVLIILLSLLTGLAASGDRNWKNHANPYPFLFGNHIDTHQETRLIENGKGKGELKGWLYVFDSGKRLEDGTPVLEHCTKPEHYAAGCVAGWELKAKPCIKEINDCSALFLYHYHDHPVWLLGARVEDSGGLRGSRQDIPQSGSYTHFHWLTENLAGFPSSLADIEVLYDVSITVPAECNVAMARQLTSGVECPGYFLQLNAGKPFGYQKWAFHHGGEDLFVQPGFDNKTHLNLLTSYRSLPPGILPGD